MLGGPAGARMRKTVFAFLGGIFFLLAYATRPGVSQGAGLYRCEFSRRGYGAAF